jgi:hypothetical protein
LYAVGLLIVNIDLARYGLLIIEIARAQYILTGAGWAAFILVPAAIGYELSGRLIAFLTVVSIAVAAIGAIAAFALKNGSYVMWVPYVEGIGILWASLSLGGMTGFFLRRVGDIANPSDITRTEFAVFGSLFLLPLLWAYAEFVFPTLPASVGGGQKPLVRLFMTSDSRVPWHLQGIHVPDECRTVGPLRLILKTDDSVVVSSNTPNFEQHNWFAWAGLPYSITQGVAHTRPPTIEINRDLISAVLYGQNSDDATVCLDQIPLKPANSSDKDKKVDGNAKSFTAPNGGPPKALFPMMSLPVDVRSFADSFLQIVIPCRSCLTMSCGGQCRPTFNLGSNTGVGSHFGGKYP